MSGLHVSGVLVRSKPERMSHTQAHLEALPGVDVCTTPPRLNYLLTALSSLSIRRPDRAVSFFLLAAFERQERQQRGRHKRITKKQGGAK